MLPITASNPFKWRHYPGDIILWCVRWYLRYPISLVHMAEMGCRAWAGHFGELHLALGSGVRSGTGQALPSAPEKNKPKLAAG
jgi:hypothetical protein